MNNYARGSKWRKWDLHVHTPCSIVNHYNGSSDEEKWENFINDLEKLPSDFKVIGINDYLFLDGYKKVLDYKNKGRLKNIDLILPVLEFRIQKFAGHKEFKRINFHVIFSNELSPNIIQSQFLNAITAKYKLSPGLNGIIWNGTITKDSLKDLGRKIKENIPRDKLNEYGTDIEEGFNNLNLNEEDIFQILNSNSYLKGKFLTAIGKTEWESLSWNDQSIAEKKDVINKVNFVFISANSVEAFQRAKNKLKEQGVNDLLLDCSDAHYNLNSNNKDRIGKCFTWIKADPTFEGLKQIIYEPEERVKIQKENPQKDYSKHYFSKISINDTKIFVDGEVSFKKTEIPLNPNLVAIIGGRGTGKSLLIDSIAKTFQKNDDKNIVIENDDFSITYTKSDGTSQNYNIQSENVLDYLHIPQGYVKDIVDPKNPNRLDKEIKELLNLPEKPQNIKYEESSINRLIDELFEIKDFLNKKDENGKK